MKKVNKKIKPADKKTLLISRVEMVKKRLPKDWRKRVILMSPEYDSLEGADLLTRLYSLRVADESLTLIVEKISADYQNELKKNSFSQSRLRTNQKIQSV